MSERIARIEKSLEYLVEAEKRRDETCSRHFAATKILDLRIAKLEEFRNHYETVAETLSTTASTGWKVLAGIIVLGGAFVAFVKYVNSFWTWLKTHL